MQGSVWGSLLCTSSMDKLPQRAYTNEALQYKYKGEVVVPPLGMVDDIITIQKCGTASVTINSEVNAFVEQKKMTLSTKKCTRIHVGKKCNECEKLYVHQEVMVDSDEVKYLGDILHKNGKIKATVARRINQGYARVGQIFSLLKDLPLGNLRTRVGLELRQAWLINGILYNSEVWHGLRDIDIANFVAIDKYLLRGIINSHAKVPIEHLYLEMGVLPLSYVISARRLIYLQTILKRPESDLIRRVYICQKENQLPGDWCQSVTNDFQKIGFYMNDHEVERMSEYEYKTHIKKHIRKAAFEELEEIRSSHSKVSQNKYSGLNRPQEYLRDRSITSKQSSLLFSLRSKTIRGIKENWSFMGQENTLCPLCERHQDSQSHVLNCPVMIRIKPKMNNHVRYEHINGSLEEQIQLVQEYEKYLELRDILLENNDEYQIGLPGPQPGPVLPKAAAGGSSISY